MHEVLHSSSYIMIRFKNLLIQNPESIETQGQQDVMTPEGISLDVSNESLLTQVSHLQSPVPLLAWKNKIR